MVSKVAVWLYEKDYTKQEFGAIKKSLNVIDEKLENESSKT